MGRRRLRQLLAGRGRPSPLASHVQRRSRHLESGQTPHHAAELTATIRLTCTSFSPDKGYGGSCKHQHGTTRSSFLLASLTFLPRCQCHLGHDAPISWPERKGLWNICGRILESRRDCEGEAFTAACTEGEPTKSPTAPPTGLQLAGLKLGLSVSPQWCPHRPLPIQFIWEGNREMLRLHHLTRRKKMSKIYRPAVCLLTATQAHNPAFPVGLPCWPPWPWLERVNGGRGRGQGAGCVCEQVRSFSLWVAPFN